MVTIEWKCLQKNSFVKQLRLSCCWILSWSFKLYKPKTAAVSFLATAKTSKVYWKNLFGEGRGGRYSPSRGLHLEASVNICLLCWSYTCNSTRHKWWLWFVLWLLNGCFHLILTSAAVIIVATLVRSWTSEHCTSLIIHSQLYKQKKWGRKGWAHEAHLCRQLTAHALMYFVT